MDENSPAAYPHSLAFWRGPFPVLLAEALAFHRKVLFRPAKYVIPWDLRYFHLPLAEFVARSFRQGHLPLWDPFTYCGWPVYAEIQTQLFYPPTLLAILLSNATGGHHLLYFLERQLVAHVVLGGVFAYLLLRRLGAGATASLLGAALFELGPFFASQTQHLCAVDAAAWLPLSWLAVIALCERVTWRSIAMLAVSLALSILSGFPAVTAVTLVSCFLLAAALQARRALAAVAAGCAWAAALAAIQILPTLELNRLSVSKYRADWIGAGGYPLESLLSMLIPNYWGIFQFGEQSYSLPWNPTFLYLYFGLIGLMFAAAAMVRPRSRYAAPVAIVTVGCLLWLLGGHTPVGLAIFRLLPDTVKIALFAEYALPAFALGMALLAGLGAERLLSKRPLAVQAALVAACAIELIAAGSGRPMNTATFDREPGIAHDRVDGFTEIPSKMRQLANQTTPPARLDTWNGSLQWSNTAALLETPTAGGNDPLAPERVMAVRRLGCPAVRSARYCELAVPDSPWFDLLNVRYILSRAPIAGSRLREAARLPGNFVYENTTAQPRFYLVRRLRVSGGLDDSLAAMRDPHFDPRTEAVVEHPVIVEDGSAPLPPVRVAHYEARSVALEVESPAPAYLVTSETAYPGWRAAIDGRPQPLYTTNAAFRGLPVPAGRHSVTMEFAPGILARGAALSLVSWAALAALLLGNWNFPRKSKPPLTSLTS